MIQMSTNLIEFTLVILIDCFTNFRNNNLLMSAVNLLKLSAVSPKQWQFFTQRNQFINLAISYQILIFTNLLQFPSAKFCLLLNQSEIACVLFTMTAGHRTDTNRPLTRDRALALMWHPSLIACIITSDEAFLIWMDTESNPNIVPNTRFILCV